METKIPEFQVSQWRFFAVLKAMNGIADIDIINEISPIKPSLLFDFLNQASTMGLISENAPGIFKCNSDIPVQIEQKVATLVTKEDYTQMLSRLTSSKLSESIDPEIKAILHFLSGHEEEFALMKYTVGFQALQNGLLTKAYLNLSDFIKHFTDNLSKPEHEDMYISATLAKSDLRFCTGGKNQPEITKEVQLAEKIAKQKGDLRSLSLIKMHLGARSLLHRKDLSYSLKVLKEGLDEAKKLGDEDMVLRSSEFQGAYYFYQGLFKKAIVYYEQALQRSEIYENRLIAYFLPHWVGMCAAYLGRFRQSIGILDCYSKRARKKKETMLADNLLSAKGFVFLMAGRTEEAGNLLNEALENSKKEKNYLGIYLSKAGLSYLLYLKNRQREAYILFKEMAAESIKEGTYLRQYSFPWFLEMLHEFNKLNFAPIPGYEYSKEIDKALQGKNIHLKGVAMRLHAKEMLIEGISNSRVMSCLKNSEKALTESGNPIELAKTWIEIARIKIIEKDYDSAGKLAFDAWESFSGLNQELFPEDLKPLIEEGEFQSKNIQIEQVSIDRFIDMINGFTPMDNIKGKLHRLLLANSKFFATERGGIFWATDNAKHKTREIKLEVGYNLTQDEIMHENFRDNLTIILKALRNNKPTYISQETINEKSQNKGILFLLCLPFTIDEKTEGVLYLDNSFYQSSYKPIPENKLRIMSQHLSTCIERIVKLYKSSEMMKERICTTIISDEPKKYELITISKKMSKTLKMIDKVADSDITVMILGETGVGKELIAHKIHKLSSRSSGPFYTVDVNNIPETLIESELFGHEKGAFTGANQRKIGRFEMANHGTLFIDEVGNIPLSIQVKLLRAIQEKSFTRVGGAKTIKSDFRLLAATNADLEKEVLAGKFREDLFFRLNVVPIHIPPLRERDEDIIYLAKYFLDMYSKKHNRHVPTITIQTEASLTEYKWPGNVRELKNIIERAVLLSSEDELLLNLPHGKQLKTMDFFINLPSMEDFQRQYISYVLKKNNNKVNEAAKILKMNRTTLYSRMRKFGLK